MSVQDRKEKTLHFASAVIPLLREYTIKLETLSDRIQKLHKDAQNGRTNGFLRATHDALNGAYLRLMPAMNDLARSASQRVEHAALDDAIRLELKLRLAEFESMLHSTRTLLDQPFP